MESCKLQDPRTRLDWLIQLPCTSSSLETTRRALRKRFEEHLAPGEQGTPEQLQRFAEAKARKMPWDDDRTTRFIIYGEDPAMAPAEPQVHVQVGLGAPALLSTHPSQYRTRGGLGSDQLEPKEEEDSPPGLADPRDEAPQPDDSILDL
eukprot:1971635-Amphidinium_carterae.1